MARWASKYIDDFSGCNPYLKAANAGLVCRRPGITMQSLGNGYDGSCCEEVGLPCRSLCPCTGTPSTNYERERRPIIKMLTKPRLLAQRIQSDLRRHHNQIGPYEAARFARTGAHVSVFLLGHFPFAQSFLRAGRGRSLIACLEGPLS